MTGFRLPAGVFRRRIIQPGSAARPLPVQWVPGFIRPDQVAGVTCNFRRSPGFRMRVTVL